MDKFTSYAIVGVLAIITIALRSVLGDWVAIGILFAVAAAVLIIPELVRRAKEKRQQWDSRREEMLYFCPNCGALLRWDQVCSCGFSPKKGK